MGFSIIKSSQWKNKYQKSFFTSKELLKFITVIFTLLVSIQLYAICDAFLTTNNITEIIELEGHETRFVTKGSVMRILDANPNSESNRKIEDSSSRSVLLAVCSEKNNSSPHNFLQTALICTNILILIHLSVKISRGLLYVENTPVELEKCSQELSMKPSRELDMHKSFDSLLEQLQTWSRRLISENESLSYRASHDSLTGLYNRDFFDSRLSRSLSRNRKAGLLFIDCNRFKQINDTYGHAVGNIVLKTIAVRIVAQLRVTDIVARLGGDEFSVLVTDVHSTDDVVSIAKCIVESMKQPLVLDEKEIEMSVSVGVAVFPEHAVTSQDLLQVADEAMYAAKRLGVGWQVSS